MLNLLDIHSIALVSFPIVDHMFQWMHKRSCCDIIAYATAMAEFKAAEKENRRVSITDALGGFELDPFLWDIHSTPRSLFVLWSVSNGTNERYMLQRVTFLHLMKSISAPALVM